MKEWAIIHMGLTEPELKRGEENQRREDEFSRWLEGMLNWTCYPVLREMSMEYWGHPGI